MKTNHWNALYVKSRTEKKVADRLERAGIEVYCPTQVVVRQWSDRKKKVREPLFKSYVFVRYDPSRRLDVLQTPGVMNIVFWLGKPAIIYQKEIEAIENFLNDHADAKVQAIDYKVGQEVRVKQGSFAEKTGTVVQQTKHKLKIELSQLGLEIFVELRKGDVALVGEQGTGHRAQSTGHRAQEEYRGQKTATAT